MSGTGGPRVRVDTGMDRPAPWTRPGDPGRGRDAVPHSADAHRGLTGPASSPSCTLTKEGLGQGLGEGDAGRREARADTQTPPSSPDTTATDIQTFQFSKIVLNLLQNIWLRKACDEPYHKEKTKPFERQIHVFVNIAFY